MVYDTFVMAGPTTHLVLREEDVVKLELEFLQNRDLHISQVTLERETGVINGHFSGNDYVNTFYIATNCLHFSQVTLERETGVINGHFSGD